MLQGPVVPPAARRRPVTAHLFNNPPLAARHPPPAARCLPAAARLSRHCPLPPSPSRCGAGPPRAYFDHANWEQLVADCFGALASRAPEVILLSDFGPGIDRVSGLSVASSAFRLGRRGLLDRAKRNLLKINELTPANLETAKTNYNIREMPEGEIGKAADFIPATVRYGFL
ncbi:hypothetical protein GGX14DRAFT_573880 [Mycena pura]|uniref:Uncharacterized protein n=1 Tax=Mycena pura TaxID=153505 RepID=A0AAD6UY16_9AGAR|nr:hypothetical protein GGX14DRAFT_573880 [Mycena pura]